MFSGARVYAKVRNTGKLLLTIPEASAILGTAEMHLSPGVDGRAFCLTREKSMKTLQCDVVVVGGGPAGTFAAVKAAENGADVILLDKGYVGKSGCGTFGAGSFKAYLKEEDSLSTCGTARPWKKVSTSTIRTG